MLLDLKEGLVGPRNTTFKRMFRSEGSADRCDQFPLGKETFS